MKKYYYVGVMSNSKKDDTLSFVYKIDYDSKTTFWKPYSEMQDSEKPLLFKTKRDAEWVAFFLFGIASTVMTTTYKLN